MCDNTCTVTTMTAYTAIWWGEKKIDCFDLQNRYLLYKKVHSFILAWEQTELQLFKESDSSDLLMTALSVSKSQNKISL